MSDRMRRSIVAGLAGIALFGACAVLVREGRVGPFERSVFETINGLPAAIEAPAEAVQYIGTLAIGPIVAVVALSLGRGRLALAAAAITAAKLLVERGIWEVLVRERPGTTQPNAIIRGDVATAGPSFVSGHVMLVTALAWVVAPSLPPRWRVAPWIVVALVAFARIYLGAHNPLDVVGGVGVGLAIGAAVDLVLRPGAREPAALPTAVAAPRTD